MRATLDSEAHETGGMGCLHASAAYDARIDGRRLSCESRDRMRGEPGAQNTRASTSDAFAWIAGACVVVPALDAASSIADVVDELRDALPELRDAIYVVDDGSSDGTGARARERGATVLAHGSPGKPRGKGSALRAGFTAARADGKHVALTVDADGQHPARAARRVLFADASPASFVLGTRDLARAGAPRANRISNGISNFFLSQFARRPLRDTQCGLRRYPIAETMTLGARGEGYDLEAEVVLRAIWAGHRVVEQPVDVLYPPDRRSHFRVGRDPWRIVATVLRTVGDRWQSTR